MAIARYGDGRVASISAGDDAGGWSRAVTIWGSSGRLRWIDGVLDYSDGSTASREARPSEDADPIQRFADELAESISHVITTPLPTCTDNRRIDVLSAVEACMLSVRTGEQESVERVRNVLDRV
jgi:predicted dehydrogenase